jgi:pimeloyl-ACP methyl ester carboxylesterase
MPIARVNGINIDYKVEGQGTPVVMISGIVADKSSWKYQVAAFKKNYRVISFDNRGAGKSDKPQGPYSIIMMARDTISLMDYLDIQQAYIIGISMGGFIAQEIGINYPERVSKLVLCSTHAGPVEGFSGGSSELMQVWNLPIRKLAVRMAYLSVDKLINRVILLPLFKYQSRSMDETTAAGLQGQKEAITAFNALDRVKTIKAPTLIVFGTKDRLVLPTSSELIAKEIPRSRLVKIENGSHLINLESGKQFNNEVLNFLNSRSA